MRSQFSKPAVLWLVLTFSCKRVIHRYPSSFLHLDKWAFRSNSSYGSNDIGDNGWLFNHCLRFWIWLEILRYEGFEVAISWRLGASSASSAQDGVSSRDKVVWQLHSAFLLGDNLCCLHWWAPGIHDLVRFRAGLFHFHHFGSSSNVSSLRVLSTDFDEVPLASGQDHVGNYGEKRNLKMSDTLQRIYLEPYQLLRSSVLMQHPVQDSKPLMTSCEKKYLFWVTKRTEIRSLSYQNLLISNLDP